MTCKHTTFLVYGIRIECLSQNVMKKCWQTSSSPSVNMDFMFQDPGYVQNKNRGFSHFLLHIYAKTHQRKHIENKNWSRLKPPKTCIESWSVNLRSHCRIHFRKSESVKIRGQYSRSTTRTQVSPWRESMYSVKSSKCKVSFAPKPTGCMYVCFPTNLLGFANPAWKK